MKNIFYQGGDLFFMMKVFRFMRLKQNINEVYYSLKNFIKTVF